MAYMQAAFVPIAVLVVLMKNLLPKVNTLNFMSLSMLSKIRSVGKLAGILAACRLNQSLIVSMT